MANGFWPAHPHFGDVLVLTNSWGKTWGINGRAYLPVEDAVRLLSEDGEVAAPTDYPARAI
jgi:C1A family cysteine protease